MKRVAKKTLIILAKLVVLSAILAYAFRQMQWNDALAVPAADAAAAGALATETRDGRVVFLLTTADDRTVPVEPGARLPVLEPPARMGAATYRVETPDGDSADLPAALVDARDAPLRRLPGLRSTLRGVRWGYLAAGLGAMGVTTILIGLRWLVLLRGARAVVPFGLGLRLHFLGLFFNTFMPGGTGGDIIKAVAVSRVTHTRAAAVSMILVDRLVGMMVLLAVPAVTLLLYPSLSGAAGRFVGVLLIALVVASFLFLSPRFRRLIRWDALLARLPFGATLQSADRAMFSLRKVPGDLLLALLLSTGVQACAILSVYLGGRAIGIEAGFRHYLIFVPAGLLANALPISFGGIGLMEGALMELFSNAGLATAAQGFMVGVLARGMSVFWALPGGVVALTGVGTAARRAAEEEPLPDSAALVPEPTGGAT